MMDIDDPLDFEDEDPLLNPPAAVNKRSSEAMRFDRYAVTEITIALFTSSTRRKKVIGLDDLLSDFYVEKSKRIEKEYKRAKSRKNYNSDDDDNGKEALLSKYVNDCHKQMKEIGGDEEIHEWGLTVFGSQKSQPPYAFPELNDCLLLKSFINNESNSLVGLSVDRGEVFLEGLLVNGWLAKLVLTCCHVEKSIAMWTLNMLLYSSKEELRTSACDFWCAILLREKEVNGCPVKINWLPTYAEVKTALEAYGFQFDFAFEMEVDRPDPDADKRGPPQNIITWIKFVTAACLIKSKQIVFLSSEAEELTEVSICLLLDPQLQGLCLLLHECMESVIGYFQDEEWTTSFKKIAKSLADRIPRDLNCLRAVECISGVDRRSKQLKSEVAYQMLVASFDHKTGYEDILSSLMSINLKDKDCDLFKTYINLALAEHWLFSSSLLEEKPAMNEIWSVFLRNCSCQITSADLRSYAPKVRNKASYLLQGFR